MNEKLSLIDELIEPSTSAIGEVQTFHNGIEFKLTLELDIDGDVFETGVEFKTVYALRFRTESACTLWHIRSFDALSRVEDSDWLREVKGDIHPMYGKGQDLSHFVIFIKNAGCYEAIAQSAQMWGGSQRAGRPKTSSSC